MKTIKRELINGVKITLISKYSNVLVQIILGIILARLLSPEEFGVAAVIMILVTFFSLLADMGIGPAVIQHKQLSKGDIERIFFFSVILAFILGLIFLLCADLIAFFYKNKIYIQMARYLSINIMFFTMLIVPKAIITRNKNFTVIGIVEVGVNIIAGTVAVILALKGASYYSIIVKSIITSMLAFLLYYKFAKIRFRIPSLYNMKKSLKKIMEFSIFQFFFNVINYFSRNMDNILIGKYMGLKALGFYDISYKLMLYPITTFRQVLNPVIVPVLKDYQDDHINVYKTYKKILLVLTTVGAMLSVMLYFTAYEIIFILYGKQWLGSVPVFEILAFSIGIQMALSSAGSIFQVVGCTKELFLSGVLGSFIMLIAIVVGVMQQNLIAVAICVVTGYCLDFFLAFYILIKCVLKQSFMDFLLNLIKPILFMIIMGGFMSFSRMIAYENVYLLFFIKLMMGGVGMIIGLFVTGLTKDLGMLLMKERKPTLTSNVNLGGAYEKI